MSTMPAPNPSANDPRAKQLFDAQAQDYARYRPTYPRELFEWLASVAPARGLAWDCGSGSGQAAVGLAEFFERVIATDVSPAQLAHAVAHPRVEYRVAPAEHSGLPDACADLVTVAQALHWFDRPRFYAEARRVLKPGGVLAAWCYHHFTGAPPEVERTIHRYEYDVVGPYWLPNRRLIDEHLQTVAFPFAELTPPAGLHMEAEWSLAHVLGYLRSWSATQRCRDQAGRDPLEAIRDELTRAWGDPQVRQWLRWPLYLRVGRV